MAVTAHIWDWIARGANQAGCDGFIAKPFKLKDLIAAVRQHLEEASMSPGLAQEPSAR